MAKWDDVKKQRQAAVQSGSVSDNNAGVSDWQKEKLKRGMIKDPSEGIVHLDPAKVEKMDLGKVNSTATTNPSAITTNSAALKVNSVKNDVVKPKKDAGKGSFLGTSINSGLSGFNRGLAATLDFILPTELAGKYDLVDPIFNMYRNVDTDYKEKAAATRDSTAKQYAGSLIEGTVQAIPNAIMAFMTGGTSLVGQGTTASLSNASKIGTLTNTFGEAVSELGKNPMFWNSFGQIAGNTYDKEIENGAEEWKATASALLNGILGSAIEVGGGIETFKLANNGWRSLLKTSLREGEEEISQYSLENFINKAVGSNDAEWLSADKDKAAVINPLAQLEQGAMGAAVGGILGGGQIAAGNLMNSNIAKNSQTGKYMRGLGIEQDIIDTGLESDPNSKSYKKASSVADIMKNRGNVSNSKIGSLYYANIEAINAENDIAQRNGVRSILINEGVPVADADRVSSVMQKALSGDPLSNTEAENIIKIDKARELFTAATGYEIPLGTMSEMRRSVKQFSDDVVSGKTDPVYVEPKIEPLTEEMGGAGNNTPIMQQSPAQPQPAMPDMSNERIYTREDIKAKTSKLGKSGQKSFGVNYQGRNDLDNFSNAFSSYYISGRTGLPIEEVDKAYSQYSSVLSPETRFSAYAAGQNDVKSEAAAKTGKTTKTNNKESGIKETKNIDRSVAKAIDIIGKATGTKIQMVDTIEVGGKKGVANGFYKDGTISIAKDADNPIIVVAKHEVTHRLKDVSPDEYEDYKDYVVNVMAKNGTLEKNVQRLDNLYQRNGQDLSYDEILDEIAADFTELIMTDEEAFSGLVSENKSIAQKLVGILKEFINKIKGSLGKTDTNLKNTMGFNVTELQKAQEMWINALKAADAMETQTDATSDNHKFSMKNPVEEVGDLVAIHNISEEKIRMALELGGLPAPSIAVVKAENDYNSYGEISLIFSKDSINPSDRRNKVFGSDVYSKRFPQISYKVDEKVVEKIRKKINRLLEGTDYQSTFSLSLDQTNVNDKMERFENFSEAYKNEPLLMLAYLKDQSKPFKPVTKSKDYGGWEGALLQKIYDNLGDESTKDWISTEEADKIEPQLRKTVNNYYKNYDKSLVFFKDELGFGQIDRLLYQVRSYIKDTNRTVIDKYKTIDKLKKAVNQNSFVKWLEDLSSGIIADKGIRNDKDLFTASGNRRSWDQLHDSYDLDSILNIMVGKVRDEEGFNYGVGNIRANLTSEFKTIKDIKQNKDKIVPAEEFVKFKEKVDNEFVSLSDRFSIYHNSGNSFDFLDIFSNTLGYVAKRGITKQNLLRELKADGFDIKEIQDNALQDALDFLNELKNAPTEYFEAKPQRAVGFDEIVAAIVPKNTNKKILGNLQDLGVKVVKYDDKKEGDRLQKLNSVEEVRFSFKDSAGNTVTDQQAEYFKNSKVRDSNGNLLVMYHGTPYGGFNEFRSGTYFTQNKELAEVYHSPSASSIRGKYDPATDERTYEVYLNIKKPFDTRNDKDRKIFDSEYYRQWGTGTPLMESGLPDWTDGMDLQEFIEENGYDYDGIILDEGGTGGYGEEVKSRGFSFVVFNSNQVKNIDNRKPTDDPDIRYSFKNNTAYHYTLADNVDSILQNGFDSTRKPLFPVTQNENRNLATNNSKYGDGVIYLTRDTKRYSKALVSTPDGSGDLNNVYFDYDKQKWFEEKGGLKESDTVPIEFIIKSNNKLLIDSFRKFNDIADKADISPAKSPIEMLIKYAKTKGYDYLEIKNSRRWKNWYEYLTGNSGNDDIFVFNKNILEIKRDNSDIRLSLKDETTKLTGIDGDSIIKENNYGVTEMKDSEGNELSLNQQNFFKDSKVRDKDGNLKVLYHGTKEEFTVFGEKPAMGGGHYRNDDINGYYFTDNTEVAQFFSGVKNVKKNNKTKQWEFEYNNVMEVYLNIKNPVTVDLSDTNFLKENSIKTHKDLARYMDHKIYTDKNDGAIILNIKENNILNTVYIVFKPDQIKSVYNLLPTESNDIRFSLKGETNILKENAMLKEMNEQLKAQFKKTTKVTVNKKKTEDYGKSLLREYSSYYEKSQITADLNSLYNEMSGDNLDFEIIKEKARDISFKILDASSVVNNELYQEYKDLIKRTRETPLKVNELDKKEISYIAGNYNEFRKKSFGTLKLVNEDYGSGLTVDEYYQSLVESHPELFDEEIANQGEQLTVIMDVIKSLKPFEENPYSDYMDEAVEYLTYDIMDQFFEIPQARPTFADRQERILTQAKIKAGEALKTERARRIDQIAKLKESYKKKEVKHAQSISDRNMRIRIERIVNELSQKLINPNDKQHVPDALKRPVAEFLKSIDFSNSRQMEGTRNKLAGLQNAYLRIAAGMDQGDSDFYLDIDPDFINVISELSESIGDKRVVDMRSGELEKLYQIARVVKATISNYNKLLYDDMQQGVFYKGESVIYELITNKPKNESGYEFLRAFDRLANINMLAPVDFFEELGTNMSDLYSNLRKGLDKKIRNTKVITDYMTDILKDVDVTEWTGNKAKTTSYPVSFGKKIDLTPAQVMSLYLLSKREQAKDHMYIGGIKHAPQTKKVKGKIVISKAFEPVKVKEADVANIISTLTPEQRKVADGISEFLNTYTSDWGNEISMKLYGYRKFTEKNYFPIKSDDNYLVSNFSTFNDPSLKGKGWTKATVRKANNPIIIDDIFDVYTKMADESSSYNAFVIPLSDIQKVVNYRGYLGSVKQSIEKKYGKDAINYLSKLMIDINGGLRTDIGVEFISKLLSNYKAATMGLNPRVIIQQPTSLIRASAMIDPKYLAQGIAKKGDWKKVIQYSPIAQWKSWGYFNMDIGRQLKDIFMGEKHLNDSFFAAIQAADNMAWSKLWNAVEYEIKENRTDLTDGTPLFYEEVGRRFGEIVDRTQVVDTVLHRTQIMRTNDTMMKVYTSFMAEPMKSYNMLRSSIRKAVETKSPEDKKKAVRTSLAWAAAVAVNSLIVSLMDVYRHSDDDDKFIDKYIESFLGNSLNDLTGMFPFIRDIASMANGFAPKRMELEGVNDALKAIKKLGDYVSAKWKGEQPKTTGAFILKDTVSSISKLFGIPIYNVKREIESFMKNYIRWTDSDELDYAMTKVFNNINNSENRSMYINILYKTVQDGDKDAAKRIYNDMLINGIQKDYIEQGLRSRMRKTLDGTNEIKIMSESVQKWEKTPKDQRTDDMKKQVKSEFEANYKELLELGYTEEDIQKAVKRNKSNEAAPTMKDLLKAYETGKKDETKQTEFYELYNQMIDSGYEAEDIAAAIEANNQK